MTAVRRISWCAREGFTLVEVLMAMLILTVGLLGLLQSIQVAFQHNARNRLREEAVQIAEEQMKAFRSLGFDAITAAPLATKLHRSSAGWARDFVVLRDWRQVGNPGDCRAKKLTVAVRWSFQNVSAEQIMFSMKAK